MSVLVASDAAYRRKRGAKLKRLLKAVGYGAVSVYGNMKHNVGDVPALLWLCSSLCSVWLCSIESIANIAILPQ